MGINEGGVCTRLAQGRPRREVCGGRRVENEQEGNLVLPGHSSNRRVRLTSSGCGELENLGTLAPPLRLMH